MDSGFGFRVSGLVSRISGFRLRVSGVGHLEPSVMRGFRLVDSPDLGFRVFGLQVSGFEFRVSSFVFRVSGFGIRDPSFGFLSSGFGFWDSGLSGSKVFPAASC